ncbi:hypothetical protein NLG97_g10073 [Lecanicillium saksenae]|uniref:Uncharacterized protein n=1 Tax=Lecanicillium saksenae TaxID=468837 RepID=A0ACC1QGY5_9HYPO|nr:hypothetical protein NLG97_g10073 [Lecanicillium saksenae]
MPELLFVTTVGQPQRENGAVRRQIRRQAMSKAAAKRKERGGYGQFNRLQYPASMCQPKSGENSLKTPYWATIPRSPSCTGYERLRIQYGVDLLDLSALTNFHVSQGTVVSLANGPSLLKHIVRSRQWSYFDYLPRYADANPALEAASRCVAARLQEFLIHPHTPTSCGTLRLYIGALRALQAELEDRDACLSSETLCATQVLGLYELLKVSNVNVWNQHSAGASALVKLRGPAHYQTDFEKSLFLSQIGQIYHEALGEQRACFLESPEWLPVLDSMVVECEPFADRGAFVMTLWKTILPLPRYVGQAAAAVRGSDEDTDRAIARLRLARLLEGLHDASTALLTEISSWDLQSYNMDAHENDKPLEARGLLLTALAIVSRLRFALCPARPGLEGEAQVAARKILLVNDEAIAMHPRAELYMAMKVHVAQTILATGPSWLAGDWAGLDKVPTSALVEWFRRIGWNA